MTTQAKKITINNGHGVRATLGFYKPEAAAKILANIPAIDAAECHDVAVTAIEPIQAHHYATDFSTHRLAWRAIEAARKAGCSAYAHLDKGDIVRLAVHRGALNGRKCFESVRYMIDGVEFALCVDGHYEPMETRNQAGMLTSFYESVVAV